MKNSTIAIIIVITLIIVMLVSGIIYAFSTSAPQQRTEAGASAEDKTETTASKAEEIDTQDTDSSLMPELKAEIKNSISDDIPGISKNEQEKYGRIKAGAVLEMAENVKNSGMKVEDIKNEFSYSHLEDILGLIGYGENFGNLRISSLYRINLIYPVEFIKQIDENNVYVVYKTLGRDNQIWYSYLFFVKNQKTATDTYDSWKRHGNVFYVAKALEYSDFAGIHAGSTNAEVHAVDPVINPAEDPEYVTQSYCSYHLLKDGLLTIVYSFNTEANALRVSELKYDDSFTFEIGDRTMSIRIDPNDLPASDTEMK